MQEDSLVEHTVHIACKCILFFEIGFVNGSGSFMDSKQMLSLCFLLFVYEFLVCRRREAICYVLLFQKVVFIRIARHLDLLGLLGSCGALSLLLVVYQSQVVIHNFDIFIPEFLANWIQLLLS